MHWHFKPLILSLLVILGATTPLHAQTPLQTLQDYLKASNTGESDQYGHSVAVSGDTAVVGALFENSGTTGINSTPNDGGAAYSGAAYVFVRRGTNWTQQAYLKASNTGVNDNFGKSVSVSGDTVVVGAPYENSSTTGVNSTPNDGAAPYSGAAYVYVRSGTNWTQQAYIKASNTGADDSFGFSVAVSGDTMVVGAPYEASSTTGVNSTPNDDSISTGAAYVFMRTGTTWKQQAYLKASNTGVVDYFGSSVAVSGDTVVVGALYEDSSSKGVNSTPNDATLDSGAVYVFVRSGSNWTQQAYLKAGNTGGDDYFGISVGVSGDTVVVGASGEDSSTKGVNSTPNENTPNSGAAYVFVRSGTNWTQQAYLKASNTGIINYFGISIAVLGETVVVGAYYEDSGTTGVNSTPDESSTHSGAAYVFVRSGTTWTQQSYLKASNTGANDLFGSSVGVSGDTVVVGAPWEDSSTTNVNSIPNERALDSGAAYIYAMPLPVITSADSVTATANEPFNFTITANFAPTSFGATSLPTGLSLNPTNGVISGTPTILGTTTITLSARNDRGTGNQTLTLTVKPQIPVITSAATATATLGQAYTYTITAINAPTSFGATNLPAGLSLNPATGVISGTPTTPGSTTITLSASVAGVTGNQTLTLTVKRQVPVITSAATVTATVRQAFNYAITATNEPTTFGSVGLPTGLSLNPTTGVISGTPTTPGSTTITLSASNDGGTGNQTLTLTVKRQIPVITSALTVLATPHQPFTYTITAINEPASFGASDLPAGLSLNPATGMISGTPTIPSTTTIIISASNDGGTGNQTLTLYIHTPLHALQAYLKASTTGVNDYLGFSVSVSGDTAVVGAYGEASNTRTVNSIPDEGAPNSGAAYVFVRSGTNWTQQAYLKASNTEENDRFGYSVAISGDTVVVGAYGEDSSTTTVNSIPDEDASGAGTAYVFVRSGTTWTQQAYLKASNTEANDAFGRSVAVSGDTAVIGASGEDSSSTGVNSTSNEGASDSGAAYMFIRNGTNWTQQAYLKASNTEANDAFARSVAVSGDTAVIGASGEDSSSTGINSTSNEGALDSGAAYVFVRNVTNWIHQAYLKASNTEANDFFGWSVAVSGDTVVVGANGEDSSTLGANSTPNEGALDSGAAYVFVRSTGTWPQQAYLKASNTGEKDGFGYFVAVSGERVVVGAPKQSASGAAYFYGPPLQIPTITSTAMANATVHQPFSHTITGTEEPTSFAAANLPAGLSLDPITGVISGTPTISGTTSFTLSAFNQRGEGNQTFTLTVKLQTPAITSAAIATTGVFQPFSHTITAVTKPTSFAAADLPAGLSLDPITGVISGILTVPGIYTIKLSTINDVGTGNQTLTLTVAPLTLTIKYVKRDVFKLIFNGAENQGALLEYTTDFQQWIPLATKGVGEKDLVHLETLVTNSPYRVYRVIKQ